MNTHKPAKEVRLGEYIQLLDGRPARVTKIKESLSPSQSDFIWIDFAHPDYGPHLPQTYQLVNVNSLVRMALV